MQFNLTQSDLGEELVVTTAQPEEQNSTVHIEQVQRTDSKNRFTVADGGEKNTSFDTGNAVFRKLEEVSIKQTPAVRNCDTCTQMINILSYF